MNLKRVEEKEFFDAMGRRDVHPRLVGRYPYDAHWTEQGTRRRVVGVSRYAENVPGTLTGEYFLVVPS